MRAVGLMLSVLPEYKVMIEQLLGGAQAFVWPRL